MPSLRICHHDTQGLYNDFLILKKALETTFDVYHQVYSEISLVKNRKVEDNHIYDVNIFLEHIYKDYICYAKKNVFFPNVEWLNSYDVSLIDSMDTICCKNEYSYVKLLKSFPQMNVIYTGFASLDRYDSTIQKVNNYVLHLKGISKYKNSQILIDTWMKHPEWPTLVVVHYGNTLHFSLPFKASSNILVYQSKISEHVLQKIMNQCKIHICCSFSEGYGHYINEARSTGAFIVTTDGYPMKEFLKCNPNGGILVSSTQVVPLNYGIGYYLKESDLEKAINALVQYNSEDIDEFGMQNRKCYNDDCNMFKERIQAILQ